MKGVVLSFDVATDRGVITGADGRAYRFALEDWPPGAPPAAGVAVEFEAVGDGEASDIRLAAVETSGKSKTTAVLLAFFLGALGAHKFYLGAWAAGVTMLAVSVLGLVLTLVPTVIVGLIAFVEFVIYLTISEAEFRRRYVTGNRHWF